MKNEVFENLNVKNKKLEEIRQMIGKDFDKYLYGVWKEHEYKINKRVSYISFYEENSKDCFEVDFGNRLFTGNGREIVAEFILENDFLKIVDIKPHPFQYSFNAYDIKVKELIGKKYKTKTDIQIKKEYLQKRIQNFKNGNEDSQKQIKEKKREIKELEESIKGGKMFIKKCQKEIQKLEEI